jgi:16S rRNA (adenine1518-N6/adenine1519-N6)-dimethyltransferase
VAVEIDPRLAALLPQTVAARRPDLAHRLTVVEADALRIHELPGPPPTALVANLPYNIAVPVLLNLLELLPTLDRALVLVQAEVAERLAAPPGGSA